MLKASRLTTVRLIKPALVFLGRRAYVGLCRQVEVLTRYEPRERRSISSCCSFQQRKIKTGGSSALPALSAYRQEESSLDPSNHAL